MTLSCIRLLSGLVATCSLFGQGAQPGPLRGGRPTQPKPLATLIVGVNEPVGSIAEPGWPLIVSALVESETNPAPSPPAGSTVTITDDKNRSVPISFEAVSRPSSATGEQSFYWLAPETATRTLAPGLYRIRVVPPAGQAVGWKFESGNLRIVSAGGDRRTLLSVLTVRRLLLQGREDDALAEANRAIASDARDQAAWIAKGDIFMLKDMPDEALEAYDGAFHLNKKTDGEPLALMTRRHAAFQRGLEKRGVIAPPAPR
jgi:hypothetical protein